MLRWLLKFAAAASVLACVGMIILIWHTTYQTHYWAFYQTYVNDPVMAHDGTCRMEFGGGQFTAVRRYDDWAWLHESMKNPPRGWRRGSVSARGSLRTYRAQPRSEFWLHWDERGWVIAVPLWALAALAAVLPGVWLARVVRARMTRVAGQCRRCGYDLRATPERCPECGEAAEHGREHFAHEDN